MPIGGFYHDSVSDIFIYNQKISFFEECLRELKFFFREMKFLPGKNVPDILMEQFLAWKSGMPWKKIVANSSNSSFINNSTINRSIIDNFTNGSSKCKNNI